MDENECYTHRLQPLEISHSMRRSHYILLLIIFWVLSSCSTSKVALDQIEGTWLLKNNVPDTLLEYERISAEGKHEGSILNIFQDSVLVDSYSLACTRFFSEGTWSLDKKKLVLKSTVPIDLQGQVYKITGLDTTKLILTKVKKN